jgi:sn-glycerol 3-phosphate transport system permease protein
MFVEVSAAVIAGPPSGEAPARGRLARGRLRSLVPPYLYVLPALASLGVWAYWPLVRTFWLSFERWNLLPATSPKPVGQANYSQLLRLPQLYQSLATTGWYMLGLLAFGVVLPMLIGVVARGLPGRAQAFYRDWSGSH